MRKFPADPAVRLYRSGSGRRRLLHRSAGYPKPRSDLEPQEQPRAVGGVQEQAA